MLFLVNHLSAQLRYNYAPYSFEAMQNYPFKSSEIVLTQVLRETPEYIGYEAYFHTMGRKMSLFVGVPRGQLEPSKGAVILLRPFQPHYNYTTGQAVEKIAQAYMLAGYVVIAPDFFGFGLSEDAPMGMANSAETYLMMPINTVELYLTLQRSPLFLSQRIPSSLRPLLPERFQQIALWGQGDGGYVALHTLALLGEPIPTILWSPVTLDFAHAWSFFRQQYSLIAGRNAQQFVQEFLRFYKVSDYAILNNLHRIAQTTPIRLTHGEADARVPLAWSQQFINSVQKENTQRRAENIKSIDLSYTLIAQAPHDLMKHTPNIVLNDIAWLKQFYLPY